MGMGFAPTWLRQVSPLLHMTTLTTGTVTHDTETRGSTVAQICVATATRQRLDGRAANSVRFPFHAAKSQSRRVASRRVTLS